MVTIKHVFEITEGDRMALRIEVNEAGQASFTDLDDLRQIRADALAVQLRCLAVKLDSHFPDPA